MPGVGRAQTSAPLPSVPDIPYYDGRYSSSATFNTDWERYRGLKHCYRLPYLPFNTQDNTHPRMICQAEFPHNRGECKNLKMSSERVPAKISTKKIRSHNFRCVCPLRHGWFGRKFHRKIISGVCYLIIRVTRYTRTWSVSDSTQQETPRNYKHHRNRPLCSLL